MCHVGRHLVLDADLGGVAGEVLVDGVVQVPGDGLHLGLVGLGRDGLLHAPHLSGDVRVVVRIRVSVLRKHAVGGLGADSRILDRLVYVLKNVSTPQVGRRSLGREACIFSRSKRTNTTLRGRCVEARQRRVELLVPGHQCHIIQAVHDGSLDVDHHFHVVVVLNVVALHDADLAIHDHELGVKRAEHRVVVVHDLEIDVGDLVLVRQTDGLARVLLLWDDVVWLEQLPGAAAVIQYLHDDPGSALAGAAGELLHGVGDELRRRAVLPVVGGEKHFLLRSHNQV